MGATTTVIENVMNIAKLTKNIPNSLKNYGASLNIIKQAGDSAITSTQGLFLATNGLNDAQTKAFLIKNQLRMGTKALTEVQLVQLLTEKGMTAEKAKETAAEVTNTVAKGANAGASGTQTVANLSLLGSIKAVTTGLLASTAAWLASPMGMVTVTAAAIYGIVKAVDYFNVSLKEQKEELSEIRQKFNELKSSLSGAESELKTTTARIKELLDLQANNKITFVEQDELDKLQTANLELEKQIELLKIQKESAQKEERASAIKVFEKDLNDVSTKFMYENDKIKKDSYGFWMGLLDTISSGFGLLGTPQWAYDVVNESHINNSGSLLATENDYLEQQVQRYEELGGKINDINLRIIELKTKQESKTITKDEKKELKSLEADAKEYENIHTYLIGKQKEFKEAIGDLVFIENPTTDDEKAFNEWYQLFNNLNDTILAVSSPEKYREWKLDEILSSDKFTDTVNKLKELGNDWQLTPSVVESYSEFNAAIEEIGVTSKDVADKLNGIAIPPEFIEFDGGELIQNVRSIQSEYNNGKLSITDANEQIEQSANDAFGNSAETIKTFLNIFKLVPPAVSSLADRPTKALNEFAEGAGKLQAALDKLAKGEILDPSEIDKLIEEFPKLRDALIIDPNGVPSLNDKIIQEVIEEMKASFERNIVNEMSSVQADIDKLEIELNVDGKSEAEIENLKKQIEDLTKKLIALSKLQSIDLSKIIQPSTSSFIEAMKEIESAYVSIQSALEEFKEATEFDSSDLESLANNFASLRDPIEDFKAGLISSAELVAVLNSEVENQKSAFLTALQQKLLAENDFTKQVYTIESSLVKNLTNLYGGNAKDWANMLNSMGQANAMAIQYFGNDWQKYFSTLADAMGAIISMHNATTKVSARGFREINEMEAKGIKAFAPSQQDVAMAEAFAKAQEDTASLLKDIKFPGVNVKSISGSSGSSKEIEAYVAEINNYYEAEEKLKRIQEDRVALQRKLNDTPLFKDKNNVQREIIDNLKEEQQALHEINNLRRERIAQNVELLRSEDFDVDYDSTHNRLLINNMEHINNLKTGDVEETNELIKATEKLIEKIFSLNDANKNASNEYMELIPLIREASRETEQYSETVRKNAISALERQSITLFDNVDISGWTDNLKEQTDILNTIFEDTLDKIENTVDEVELSRLYENLWETEDSIKSNNRRIYDESMAQYELYIRERNALSSWGAENEITILRQMLSDLDDVYQYVLTPREYNEESLSIRERIYQAEKTENDNFYNKMMSNHERYIQSKNTLSNWGTDSEISALKRWLDNVKDCYSKGIISVEKFYEDSLMLTERLYNAEMNQQKAYIDGVLKILDKEKQVLEEKRDAYGKQKSNYEIAAATVITLIDKQIKALNDLQRHYEKQKSNYETAASTIIGYVDEQIEALRQLQTETEEQKNLYEIAAREAVSVLNKQLEAMQALQKETEKQKSNYETAASTVIKFVDKQIEALQELHKYNENEKGNYETVVSTVTSLIDEQIKALQSANDEVDKRLKLEKALEAIELARKQRNKQIYIEGQGFVWQADQDAIDAAQEEYDKTLQEFELEEQIRKLEEYKQQWQNTIDDYQRTQNELLASEYLGVDWEKEILDMRTDNIEEFSTKYKEFCDQLNEDVEGSIASQIKSWEDYKGIWQDAVSAYQDAHDELIAIQIFGSNWEEDILNRRTDHIAMFVERYSELSDLLNENVEGSILSQITALEDYKKGWEDAVEAHQREQNKQIALEILGENWEEDILNHRTENLDVFLKQYGEFCDQLNEHVENSLSAQIKAWEEYKSVWQDAVDSYKKEQDRMITAQIYGADWEKLILEQRHDAITTFLDQHKYFCDLLNENTENSLASQIKSWEDYKISWEDVVSDYQSKQDEMITSQILGEKWEEEILDQREDNLKTFTNNYNYYCDQLNSDTYGSVAFQIAQLDKLANKWNDSTSEITNDLNRYEGVLNDLRIFEGSNYEARLNILDTFVNSSKNKLQSLRLEQETYLDSLSNLPNADNGSIGSGQGSGNSGGSGGGSGGIPNTGGIGAGTKNYGGVNYDPTIDYQAKLENYIQQGAPPDILALVEQQRNAKIGGEKLSEHKSYNYEKWYKGFATGGVADFTGLAQLHGTKQKPELILNNADTTKVYNMIHDNQDLGADLRESAKSIIESTKILIDGVEYLKVSEHPELRNKILPLQNTDLLENIFNNSQPYILSSVTDAIESKIKTLTHSMQMVSQFDKVPNITIQTGDMHFPDVTNAEQFAGEFANAIVMKLGNKINQAIYRS